MGIKQMKTEWPQSSVAFPSAQSILHIRASLYGYCRENAFQQLVFAIALFQSFPTALNQTDVLSFKLIRGISAAWLAGVEEVTDTQWYLTWKGLCWDLVVLDVSFQAAYIHIHPLAAVQRTGHPLAPWNRPAGL